MIHKPTYSQQAQYRAYLIVAAVIIFFVLLINVLYLLGFKIGQDGQNMFFKITRRENQESMQAMRKSFEQKLDSSNQAVQVLSEQLEKTEQEKTTYQISNSTLTKELDKQREYITTVLQKDVQQGVEELRRESKALRQEVKNNREQNRIRVDAKNQLVSITRDSLPPGVPPIRAAERLKVINFKEKAGWFTITGNMQDTAFTFNPAFNSKYDLSFEKIASKGGFLNLNKKYSYKVKVKDRNPYNATPPQERIFAESETRRTGTEPYKRERKRINSKPKFKE